MTALRMLRHIPLLRLDEAAISAGPGQLVTLAFDDYNTLSLGAFEDSRRRYERSAPTFYSRTTDVQLDREVDHTSVTSQELREWLRSESAVQAAIAEFDLEVALIHAGLTVMLPEYRLPEPRTSIAYYDLGLANPVTSTAQGEADEEYLFVAAHATPPVTAAEIHGLDDVIRTLANTPDDLTQALTTLIETASPVLGPDECTALSTMAIEDLLLPDITTSVTQTFARRLASLLSSGQPERDRIERLARRVYDSRSRAVHAKGGGDPAADVDVIARRLLAGSIREVAAAAHHGEDLGSLRERLDAEGSLARTPFDPSAMQSRQLWTSAYRPSRDARDGSTPPASSGSHTIPVPAGDVVLIAPLIGLEAGLVEHDLLQSDFPLSWVTSGELLQLEDPDIRRDWVASIQETVLACVALEHAAPALPSYESVRPCVDALAHWRDLAVVALRLAGFRQFVDPELLGDFVMADRSYRMRWPSIYRQTLLLRMEENPERLPASSLEQLLSRWLLLKRYLDNGADPEIETVLGAYRRAHFNGILHPSTRALLLFACVETLLGRAAEAQERAAVVAKHCSRSEAEACTWFVEHGRAVRNAVAHGYWEPDDAGPRGGEALGQLSDLVSTLLPMYLDTWLANGTSRPAEHFQSLVDRDDGGEWSIAPGPSQSLAPRFVGLDGAAMTRKGTQLYESGDAGQALQWLVAAAESGDAEGASSAGRLLASDPASLEAARQLLVRATELGDQSALADLGAVESRLGDVDAARAHYQAAIDVGDVRGVLNLGLLEARLGNIDEAVSLLRVAADNGEPRAMRQLGLMSEEAGDLPQAEEWFAQAAGAGNSAAMNDLAVLAIQRGDVPAARLWWERAAGAGNANAVESLARLAAEQGGGGG